MKQKFITIATVFIALAISLPVTAGTIKGENADATLKVADIQVREGEKAEFVLMLSEPLNFDIRYAYHTRDLTAKAGKDYVAESGYFKIPAGRRIMVLDIKTLKDNIIDRDSFELVLSDFKTRGYGKVWGRYIWTGYWSTEGLAGEITAKAHIINVLPASNRLRIH